MEKSNTYENKDNMERQLNEKDRLGLSLVGNILHGCDLDGAKIYIKEGANLGIADYRTGFTVFHASAAVGRKDLFDLFREATQPNYQARDNFGRTAADLAAMLANNFELCEHIYELEARSLKL